MELELVLDQRLRQFRLDLDAHVRDIRHFGHEDREAALALRFRRIHRDVGIAQQFLDAVLRRREGDADARGDPQVAAEERERFLQRRDDAPRDLDHRVLAGQVLEQHREFIAAEARDRVAAPRALDQALGARAQHAIAFAVAEAVVDGLEVVEVDEQHRHAAIAALADRERVLDAVAEQRAIREQGQRVVECEAPQLLLDVLAVACVAHARQPADHGIHGAHGARMPGRAFRERAAREQHDGRKPDEPRDEARGSGKIPEIGREQNEAREAGAKQQEPGRRMVKPWRQAPAQGPVWLLA